MCIFIGDVTFLKSTVLFYFIYLTATLATHVFFQADLLDGLSRWNEDRAVAATDEQPQPHSYNHLLRHAANTLSEEVLAKKIHW